MPYGEKSKLVEKATKEKKGSMANYGSPLDKKGCSGSSPLSMKGSWMSKHCNC
jgi:hypothetical protein